LLERKSTVEKFDSRAEELEQRFVPSILGSALSMEVALPPLPEHGIAARERSRGRESGTASRLATRLELLRNTLRPTPHVPLAMEGMNLFAKLEYVNPVGSI
jgi:hypothetical protein